MKKILKAFISALLVSALVTITGCSAKAPEKDGLKVITVNFPPYDFVKQITGGSVIPDMLLKGGQDAHTYEPTAKDIMRINDADLFICTGGESDAWVDRIAGSLDGGVKIIRMTDFAELIETGHEEHEHAHDHDADEYDEHVWTSPKNAITICEGITDALCEVAPGNAELYRSGLDEYKALLSQLSDELQAAADKLKSPLIFGDRFPFMYMARDYGIEYYAAFSGCSSDTEPSAAKMTELIDKAKETNARVIYHIEFSTEKVAKALAESVGADIRLMHSCHTVSEEDLTAGETYISIMRRNIAAFPDA